MVKDRMAVLTALMDQGVIPVFYHPDVEVCKKVIQACADGGAPCIEFTNRGDFASHVFYEVTRHFASAGAGIVAAGMGSKLITQELLDAGDYAGITAKVRETVDLIKKVRGKA
jgi:2-keto-3-deoxy-6-phosphogluconate aldolase